MSKKNWMKCLVSADSPLLETVKIIDAAELQIALVVDDSGRLLGTVTDGDVRRGILKGIPFSEPTEKVMNRSPLAFQSGQANPPDILQLMRERSIRHVPLVDAAQRVTGMLTMDDLMSDFGAQICDNWVVVMAGGLGSRLAPLTDECPKPLLPVGSRPILETILKNFIEAGFRKFFFSLNYKGHMIREHFGDGSKWNCEIRYLEEDTRLGTAGALSLLEERPQKPLIVMNGDLLTKVNFRRLLEFHATRQAQATMCVREYEFQVPYGVVTMQNDDLIAEISEKPTQRFFVNAGIYVLEPTVFDLIPKSQYLDMPQLFEKLLRLERRTAAFPIREYWLDIGQLDDLKRASSEFGALFQ